MTVAYTLINKLHMREVNGARLFFSFLCVCEQSHKPK